MRPPVSSGNKGLCLLKDSCFHPETKTFVSFDAGGGSTDMMSQRKPCPLLGKTHCWGVLLRRVVSHA